MAKPLPTEYVLQQFYAHCKRPTRKKGVNIFNSECPVCNEGHSSGRKRRLFYYGDEHYFYCFNCTQSWTEWSWIQSVARKSYGQIIQDLKEGDFAEDLLKRVENYRQDEYTPADIPVIPPDSVDVMQPEQVAYYKGDDAKYSVLMEAVEVCKDRRLFTAIQKPKSLYVSFDDPVHKNRLIIPFYDFNGKIASYQSRLLFTTAEYSPKYLTKFGNKSLYGENLVNPAIPYLFLFEGPIDAMFVQNGLGMGGTSLTSDQQNFVNRCLGMEKIHCFDNDKDNDQMKKRIDKVIQSGEKVFFWPREFSKYKDVNEICCALGIDEMSWKFFLQNSAEGLQARIKAKMT